MDYYSAMQIDGFVKVYQAKSDEELVQLAADPEQLTPEARIAMQSELSRRGISTAQDSEPAEGEENRPNDGQVAGRKRSQNVERQGVGDFMAEVLRTYHKHFWLYFKITAPAVVISTIAIMVARYEGREIARHIPNGTAILAHQTEVLEIWLIYRFAYLVGWIAFSFTFGAICIAVEEKATGYRSSAWHSLLNIRERLGPFLRLSLLLFILELIAESACDLFWRGMFWARYQWGIRPSSFSVTLLSYVTLGLACLVLSRFALSVPALILDDYEVGQAIFRSDALTQGNWTKLAALLVKSAIGGYVGAKAPFWLISLLPGSTPLPSWFPWVLTAASVIGVILVEPPLFIGFALLYLKMSALVTTANRDIAAQLA